MRLAEDDLHRGDPVRCRAMQSRGAGVATLTAEQLTAAEFVAFSRACIIGALSVSTVGPGWSGDVP
jgi:hypothetical protein